MGVAALASERVVHRDTTARGTLWVQEVVHACRIVPHRSMSKHQNAALLCMRAMHHFREEVQDQVQYMSLQERKRCFPAPHKQGLLRSHVTQLPNQR